MMHKHLSARRSVNSDGETSKGDGKVVKGE